MVCIAFSILIFSNNFFFFFFPLVQERVAETFISAKGRVMLGGDSAHVHSVNGGQGLNTGMADAFALVWRLALNLKGILFHLSQCVH